jgi:hypothetical protein
MKFHATRIGHTRNAKELLKRDGHNVDNMPDDEVDRLISEQFIAMVMQEDASDYDEIYLIPKGELGSIYVINR